MKNCTNLLVGAILVAVLVGSVSAQDAADRPRKAAEARGQVRERSADSPRTMGAESQLEALNAIKEQADKLITAIKSGKAPDFGKLRQMSQEARGKIQGKLAEMWGNRRKAIAEIEKQVGRLKGGRAGAVAQARVTAQQLRAILESAKKEGAKETAALVEKLLARSRPAPRERGGGDRPAREGEQRDADAGRKAPSFEVKTFDGKAVSLADYRRQVVVLEWFNFECPFSRYHYQTKKTMIELAKKYKDKGVVWLVVNSTNHTTPQANLEFSKKHSLPFPILDDRDGKIGKAYGAKTTPHMFVVDRRGSIVYDGAIDNAPSGKIAAGQEYVNYVDKVLSELIDRRDISVRQTKSYGCSVKYAR